MNKNFFDIHLDTLYSHWPSLHFAHFFVPPASPLIAIFRLAVSAQLLWPVGRARPRAGDAGLGLAVDVAAEVLGRALAIERRDGHVLKAEAGAGGRGAAVHGGGDVVARGAGDVDPADVGDGEAALVAGAGGVDARGDVDGLVDVLGDDVGEGDVLDVAVAAVRLDPRRVGAVRALDVVEDDVVDEVGRVARVVAQAADRRAPGLVAVHVFDDDVAAVAFDGDAVVAAGHCPVLDEDVLRVPGVGAVRVHGAPLAVAGCVHV